MIAELYSFFVELLELLTLITRHVIEMPLRLARLFEQKQLVFEADDEMLPIADPGTELLS